MNKRMKPDPSSVETHPNNLTISKKIDVPLGSQENGSNSRISVNKNEIPETSVITRLLKQFQESDGIELPIDDKLSLTPPLENLAPESIIDRPRTPRPETPPKLLPKY